MRLPEFTAEKSLGKTRKRYLLETTAGTESGVVPQFCMHHPGSNFVTCGGCVDTDGDGIAETCFYTTHQLVHTLM